MVICLLFNHYLKRINSSLNPNLNNITIESILCNGQGMLNHNITNNIPIYYSTNVGDPYNNLHEKLFICGKNGVAIFKVIIHALYYICTMWQLIYPFYHFYSLAKKWYIIIIFIVSTSIYLYSVVFLLHKPISLFSISTSIQMMKHQDIIHKVIFAQNLTVSQHCFGIFRVIKTIYAQMTIANENLIQQFSKYICNKLENDITISCQNPDSFPVNNLHSLIKLSGQTLSKQDKLLFLSKCDCEGDTLSGSQILNALIKNMEEMTINRYDLIVNMFELTFQATNVNLHVREMLRFFEQYQKYFENDDYEYNKVIISSLGKAGMISAHSYASAICASISEYPT